MEEKRKGDAWKRQRNFKKDNIVSITPEQMLKITQDITNVTMRTLVALLYITGCRVSELIRYERLFYEKEEYLDADGKKRKRTLWRTRRVVESLPGIKKNQLRYEDSHELTYLVITTRNLKNRHTHEKTIPLNCSRPINQGFLQIIDDYIETLSDEDEMFPYTRPQIEYKLKKFLPFNIHYIRDIRATHLYVLYDLKEEELKRAMGWTDSRPASRYVAMRWTDFAEKT